MLTGTPATSAQEKETLPEYWAKLPRASRDVTEGSPYSFWRNVFDSLQFSDLMQWRKVSRRYKELVDAYLFDLLHENLRYNTTKVYEELGVSPRFSSFAFSVGSIFFIPQNFSPGRWKINIIKRPAKTKKMFVDNLGLSYFCIDDYGAVYAWGFNSDGRLGMPGGCWGYQNTPTPKLLDELIDYRIDKIVSHNGSTFFITESGEVFACGRNHRFKLGLGHSWDAGNPSKITIPFQHVIVDIVCSDDTTFFITERGAVLVCGDNNRNKLGSFNETSPFETPQRVGLGQNQIDKIFCTDNGIFFITKPTEGEPSKTLACGNIGHFKLEIAPGTLEVQGLQGISITDIYYGIGSIFFISKTGNATVVYACGDNYSGQLGISTQRPRAITSPTIVHALQGLIITNIVCESGSTYFITKQGQLFVCGKNEHGQLGLNREPKDCPAISQPTLLQTLGDRKVAGIVCKNTSVTLITNEGLAFAWGCNTDDNLGLLHYHSPILTPTRLQTPNLAALSQSFFESAKRQRFSSRYGSDYQVYDGELLYAAIKRAGDTFPGILGRLEEVEEQKRLRELLQKANDGRFIFHAASYLNADDFIRLISKLPEANLTQQLDAIYKSLDVTQLEQFISNLNRIISEKGSLSAFFNPTLSAIKSFANTKQGSAGLTPEILLYEIRRSVSYMHSITEQVTPLQLSSIQNLMVNAPDAQFIVSAVCYQNIKNLLWLLSFLSPEQLGVQLAESFATLNLDEYAQFIWSLEERLAATDIPVLRYQVNRHMVSSPHFATRCYKKFKAKEPMAWVIQNQPGQEYTVQDYHRPISKLPSKKHLTTTEAPGWIAGYGEGGKFKITPGTATVFLLPREKKSVTQGDGGSEPVLFSAAFFYAAIKYFNPLNFQTLLRETAADGAHKYAFVTILTSAPDARFIMEAVIHQEKENVERLIRHIDNDRLTTQIKASLDYYKILVRNQQRTTPVTPRDLNNRVAYITAWETFEKMAQIYQRLKAILDSLDKNPLPLYTCDERRKLFKNPKANLTSYTDKEREKDGLFENSNEFPPPLGGAG